MLAARPMPDSSMPPCHTGMPHDAHRSCSRIDSPKPPTRPGLMLMMRQAPERLAALLRVQIPRGHLDGRLRHAVAADRLQRGKDIARMVEGRAEDTRRDEVVNDVPAGLVRLGAVVRILLRDALAVAGDA